MKIGIIGTRGIPNYYGGFEQFAEYLSFYLAKEGHDVTVYNSHTHPYQEKEWNGVHIKHCYDPEDRFGTVGQFVYDLNCILHSRSQQYDVILQLGYTSSSIWGWLMPKKSVIVTNMDGMEWKRSKYSPKVQRFLRYAEKLAVRFSDHLVADSVGIRDYLQSKYSIGSEYIPYGANRFRSPDAAVPESYEVQPYRFDMLIARLEPENNIETILTGVRQSGQTLPFLVVGNHKTKYGTYLKEKFADTPSIRFIGTIYDISKLNNLRYYSRNYFHGHTVGGTNPSLLEAMASGALITAHDNIFNKSILGEDSYYFSGSEDVARLLGSTDKASAADQQKLDNNYRKIETVYSWEQVNGQYLNYLRDCLAQRLQTAPGSGQAESSKTAPVRP